MLVTAQAGHLYVNVLPEHANGYEVIEYDTQQMVNFTVRNNMNENIEVYIVKWNGYEHKVWTIYPGNEQPMESHIADEFMVRSSTDQSLLKIIRCNGEEKYFDIYEGMPTGEETDIVDKIEHRHKTVVLDRYDNPVGGFLYAAGRYGLVATYEHPDS